METSQCKGKGHWGATCGRPLYDNEYCIFHSEAIFVKKKDFNEAFWEEFERQKREKYNYDFAGFVFPDSISFKNIKFDKETIFTCSKFYGEDTDFGFAKFLGEKTSFGGCHFKGHLVSFNKSYFKGEALFGGMITYEDQHIDLEGACFESKIIDFSEAEFSGYVNFQEAEFDGNSISFSNCKFKEGVIFGWGVGEMGKQYIHLGAAKLKGIHISFSDTEFLGEKTDFCGVKFSAPHIHFNRAKFYSKETDLSESEFTGEKIYFGFFYDEAGDHEDEAKFSCEIIDFRNAKFKGEEINFHRVQFIGKKHIFFEGAEFYGVTSFKEANFKGKSINFYNSYLEDVEGLFEVLEEKSKIRMTKKYKLENLRLRLGEETSRRYPVVYRKVQDDWFLNDYKKQYPKVFFIWNLTSKCGRSLLRWAFLSLVIAIFFGAIYADYSCPSWLEWINYNQWLEKINPVMVVGQPYNSENMSLKRKKTGFTPYYFSIVTFTTLGFGDITPMNKAGEIWLAIEVILGYIMLGGLISIFANKLARRS